MCSMAFMIGLGILCGYDECAMSKQDAGKLDGVVRGVPLFSFIGGVTGVSLFTVAAVGFGAVATLALEPSRYASQPELARLLLGLMQLAVNMTGFLTAVSNAAFCVTLARGCGFRDCSTGQALALAGAALAVLHLISGGAYATSGLLAPSGLGVFVCAPVYYIWLLAISMCMLFNK